MMIITTTTDNTDKFSGYVYDAAGCARKIVSHRYTGKASRRLAPFTGTPQTMYQVELVVE